MKEVLEYLNKLLKKDDKIIVAVSGGPDSMCLLHLLYSLKEKLNLEIITAHVNHNIRESAKSEEKFVKKFCEERNIIFETMTIESLICSNFQHETRRIRYDFFESLINKYKANYLMIAHHGDDLIETILMRMVRGSSFAGYAGFKKQINKDNYEIIRPLIKLTKEEIILYLKENNIKYVIDESNNKDDYTRNRFRHNVLPFLKKENGNVHKKFLKFHQVLTDYDEYFKKIINKDLNKVFKNNKLDLKKYKELDDLMQTKIIEEILEQQYNEDLNLITDQHVREIKKLIDSKSKNVTISFADGLGLVVVKSYDTLTFEKKKYYNEPYNIKLEKEVKLPEMGKISIIEESDLTDNYCTRLNSKEVKLPIYIRTRKDGDKIEVKNLGGTKKINDIFIDMKIPLRQRDSWPIVVDSNDKIIWLPGLKKSKFDKERLEKYDIILRYFEEECEK